MFKQLPDQHIKYGDVFDVSGELAEWPVAPRDAAMLQSAEQAALGRTQKGSPAAVLQSAAALNAGATVTDAELPGRRVATESIGEQVVAKLVAPAPVVTTDPSGAQEAAAATARDRPVDQSDAAAVQATEMLATWSSVTVPGGVAAAA